MIWRGGGWGGYNVIRNSCSCYGALREPTMPMRAHRFIYNTMRLQYITKFRINCKLNLSKRTDKISKTIGKSSSFIDHALLFQVLWYVLIELFQILTVSDCGKENHNGRRCQTCLKSNFLIFVWSCQAATLPLFSQPRLSKILGCVQGGKQAVCWDVLDQLQPALENEDYWIINWPGETMSPVADYWFGRTSSTISQSVRYSNVLIELFQIDIVGFISAKWHIYEHFHISFKFSCSFGTGKLQLFHCSPTSYLQKFRLRARGTRPFVRFLDQLQSALENEENKLLNDQQK
jgi:hypothetical protein